MFANCMVTSSISFYWHSEHLLSLTLAEKEL